MLLKKFQTWLMSQSDISSLTQKDYIRRLKRICHKSEYHDDIESLAVDIMGLLQKHPNSSQISRNDISALKKFNEFLYETQYVCSATTIKNQKPILAMLSWFPGSATEAPQIKTSCNNGEDDLLTPGQVAHFLSVTPKTLREWRKKNLYLTYLNLPQGARYPRQAVNELLKARFREVLIKK